MGSRYFLKLIFRNALRQRLRAALTLVGLVIAVMAFGLLQTIVQAWYAGADGASVNRLVTRNAISLVFPLPLNYRDKIRQTEGVSAVSYASWFGGVYITEKNFFPQFAVEPISYFSLYPEYRIEESQMREFLHDRHGAVIGRRVADVYGLKVGDVMPLRGTIYPGTWNFVIRAIYDGAQPSTDTSQFFFHWEYLNETVKKTIPRRANQIGVYVIGLRDASSGAVVAQRIDRGFENSLAETLTETEKAFQLGFVSMTEAIVVAIRIVSFLVIFIILAVMANTMAMTARERVAEYATFKALGFGPRFVMSLIAGESLLLSLLGGAIGIALTYPLAREFGLAMGTLFKSFAVSSETIGLQAGISLLLGVVAAIVPAIRAAQGSIVDGLRHMG